MEDVFFDLSDACVASIVEVRKPISLIKKAWNEKMRFITGIDDFDLFVPNLES